MRRTNVSHGSDGFFLTVDDVPRWAVAVEEGYMSLLAALGHPCCYYTDSKNDRRTLWGWLYDHLPLPEKVEEEWQLTQYRLLNNRLAHFSYPRIKNTLRVPISAEQAAILAPNFVREELEEGDD